MGDNRYCYPDSDVLINKLNIQDQKTLFEAEKRITFARLRAIQRDPIDGNFDFEHLKAMDAAKIYSDAKAALEQHRDSFGEMEEEQQTSRRLTRHSR